jgi:putative ABC transport system permease protein
MFIKDFKNTVRNIIRKRVRREFVSIIIAIPVSYYALSSWQNRFSYKAELSWWIFALARVIALAIALLSLSWQSWSAATRNPVEALRYE